MNKNSYFIFALLIVFAISIQSISAQSPTSTNGDGEDPYDTGAFDRIKWGNLDLLNPYLGCYAKKHDLELVKVTDHAFYPRGFENSNDMKLTLQEEQSKLIEIGNQLKSQLRSRPNTGKTYHYNPAIWEEIINNLGEYMPCAIVAEQSRRTSESVYMKMYLEDIRKMQQEVDEYDPSGSGDIVKPSTANYLLFAMSKREREIWLSDSEEFKPTLDPLLDALAASAAKKLTLYKPAAAWFKIRDAAAEKQIMGIFKNPATINVHQIGLESAGWDIQKDNYGILPLYRYKSTNVYYRDSSDDHPYCRVASVRVKQDYAGGGRYSTKTYRSSAQFMLVGCLAITK